MERSRATWTDERLDDLARRMDDGLGRVHADLRSLRGEMTGQFSEVNQHIGALQRTMVHVGGGMIAALVAGFLGLIATQL